MNIKKVLGVLRKYEKTLGVKEGLLFFVSFFVLVCCEVRINVENSLKIHPALQRTVFKESPKDTDCFIEKKKNFL